MPTLPTSTEPDGRYRLTVLNTDGQARHTFPTINVVIVSEDDQSAAVAVFPGVYTTGHLTANRGVDEQTAAWTIDVDVTNPAPSWPARAGTGPQTWQITRLQTGRSCCGQQPRQVRWDGTR